MTPEQLELFYYDIGDYDELCDAKAQAKRDLEAMRTPITREALEADGWAMIDTWVYSLPGWVGSLYVLLRASGIDVTLRARLVRGVRTMYDLRELVRLLGGDK